MSYLDLFKKHKMYRSTMEYFKKKYDERDDKDNMFGTGMTDREFVNFIIKELLGDDWYITDPLAECQAVECAFLEILEKYSPKKGEKSNDK